MIADNIYRSFAVRRTPLVTVPHTQPHTYFVARMDYHATSIHQLSAQRTTSNVLGTSVAGAAQLDFAALLISASNIITRHWLSSSQYQS